jgi:type I restriction enzyme, S subunit
LKTIEKAATKSRVQAKHADSPSTKPVRTELIEGQFALWEIPPDWRWSTLGQETKIVGGGTPLSSEESYFGGEIAWLTPADLSGYNEKFISQGARNLTISGLQKSGARLMPAGTVLFSSRAPIGYVAIAANEISTNQGFKSFTPCETLSSDYLYYWMQRAKEFAIQVASGTTFLEISGKATTELPVPVPPPSTQHRIVAEIEEKLSRLDAAQSALLRAQANLKRYRLSVLNAAITGAYSEPVKSSNAYLPKLLATHKSEWLGRGKYKEPATPNVPKGAQLPSGWVWASLDQLLGHVTDGDHQAPPQTSQGIPFLVIGNVRRGKIDLSDTRFVSTDYFNQLDRARVPRKGDLLYTLVGSYGIPVPVDVDEAFCIQRHMGILRPHSMSPMAYLQLAMASDFVFQQATVVSTGTAQRTVPLAGLRRMAIPLPPLELQNQIVEDVERRLSVIDLTEQTLRTQLERAKRLRQSILQQAFSPTRQDA